ncbi:hypothetical protein [Streptomyces sp. NPDC086519]|uniref:hypothetical protein n=1 Tax=Streptomyces sp. NPDC086519 TaxID=3154863 RepID=UPI0034162F9D
MITVPLFLLFAFLTWLCWRADIQMGALICALVCGYALAASPLSAAIDGIGQGIATAVQHAGSNQARNR